MIAEVHGYLRRLQGEQEALLRPHRAVKFGPRVRYGPRKAVRCQRRLYEDDDGWAQSWLDYRLRDYGGMPQLPLYKIVRQQPCFLILHMFSGRWRARPTRSVGGAHPWLEVLSEGRFLRYCSGWNLRQSDGDRIELAPDRGLLRAGCRVCLWCSVRDWTPDDPSIDTSRWPRPLRSAERPWELADLCPRELLQLRTGCNFSLQTLWVWLVSWGVMMSEHPALPKALERVSIFTTPVAKLLRSIPEIELNVLPQGWWVRLPGNLRVCWLCGSRGSRRQCINGAWRIHLLLSPLLLAELPMGSSKLQRWRNIRRDPPMEWPRPVLMTLRQKPKTDGCVQLRLSYLLPLSIG